MRHPKLRHFVIDVDGVMTTGQFIYTADGKVGKVFGPHDSDGLKLIKHLINIQFITADQRGFDISKKRIVDDMGYPLTLVTEAERESYIEQLGFDFTAFMGDGYYDAPVLQKCAVGIAPASGRYEARRAARFITSSRAAEGALMDACIYLKGILTHEYDEED